MKSVAVTSIVSAGALALAGCVDNTVVAPATSRAPSFALSSSPPTGGATGRYIVSFNGSPPATFSGQVVALGGTVQWISRESGLAVVRGLSSAAAAALATSPRIQQVEADELVPLDVPQISVADAAVAAGVVSNADPTTAARYARQWNMRAVQADAAWAHGFLGSSSVSVFMLDTGIDYLHADLVGRVDLGRSVDLLGTFTLNGVPFTERDTVTKYFPTRLPITDLYFHGTHTGATVSSNAVRAAGVTSGTTLVAVKVCAYLDGCPFSSILNGVIYAADNGADVMNLSLGGSFPKAGNGRFVGFVNKVFNYAQSKGVTIVVSAGNDAADLDHDGNSYASFCATPAVICVAATGPTAQASVDGPWTDVDAPSYFTNFGRSAISVAAPGGNNASFVWAACSQTVLAFPSLAGCRTAPIFIVGAQGTSMSAPHVSGTAALLVSILGRNPGQIKARIQQSADNVGGNGTTPFYGKGRVNVARAVGAIP